jgi:hypothetical protein
MWFRRGADLLQQPISKPHPKAKRELVTSVKVHPISQFCLHSSVTRSILRMLVKPRLNLRKECDLFEVRGEWHRPLPFLSTRIPATDTDSDE